MSEPSSAPESPAQGTNWDLVQRLKSENVPRDQMLAQLKAKGLDDESANVLINSVSGALPPELPEAQLTVGTNVLAPATFSLSDLGLSGHPATVGLYWMGFGAAILLALGIGFLLTEVVGTPLPEDVGYYALRLGGVVSMACVTWGLIRYSQGVTIKRKP